jgi:hypothetical protein
MKVLLAMEHVTSWPYRATKRLEEDDPVPDGSFPEIEEFLIQLWARWGEMRSAMREDLGVID